jgi:hypothetical protein
LQCSFQNKFQKGYDQITGKPYDVVNAENQQHHQNKENHIGDFFGLLGIYVEEFPENIKSVQSGQGHYIDEKQQQIDNSPPQKHLYRKFML